MSFPPRVFKTFKESYRWCSSEQMILPAVSSSQSNSHLRPSSVWRSNTHLSVQHRPSYNSDPSVAPVNVLMEFIVNIPTGFNQPDATLSSVISKLSPVCFRRPRASRWRQSQLEVCVESEIKASPCWPTNTTALSFWFPSPLHHPSIQLLPPVKCCTRSPPVDLKKTLHPSSIRSVVVLHFLLFLILSLSSTCCFLSSDLVSSLFLPFNLFFYLHLRLFYLHHIFLSLNTSIHYSTLKCTPFSLISLLPPALSSLL